MKNLINFLILFTSTLSFAQISTISDVDGSILITPKGLLGKTNSSSVDNLAFGKNALKNNLYEKEELSIYRFYNLDY